MKEDIGRLDIPVDHAIHLAVDQSGADIDAEAYDLLLRKLPVLHDLLEADQPLHPDKDIPADGIRMLDDLIVLDIHDIRRSAVIHHHRDFLDTPLNDLPEIFPHRLFGKTLGPDLIDFFLPSGDRHHFDRGIILLAGVGSGCAVHFSV